MAIPTVSLTDLLRRGLAYFRTSFLGFPLGIKRFLGKTARAVVLNLWGLHKKIEVLDVDIVPSPKSSSDALSAWAFDLGLPDGEGGYGKLKPTAATGGLATLTGVKGTIYPDEIVATAEDGTTQIALSGAVTIPGLPSGFGSVDAQFIAVTKGTDGNLPEGTVCTWVATPAGADPTFTLTASMAGGNPEESNPDVYARIVARLQTPPKGGVAEDYRLWAQAAGAGDVFVYPRRSGSGTVDLVITVEGTGQGRSPSFGIQTDVEAAILAARPVAVEKVNVLLPYMPAGHLIRTRVVPSRAKFDFDWDSTVGGPFTVDLYVGGPPATLRLNTLAPDSLKDAIDTYIASPTTALKPRLQVLSDGSVINGPIGCVAWSDGGGKTTLTLETVPDTWITPTVGDTVYSYGPVVATIAAGQLALVDSLGPSRVSGYGDAITPWFDTLSISSISAVAEEAIDSDGAFLIEKVPVGQCTIDAVAADVQADDNTPNAPELLFASQIAVTD